MVNFFIERPIFSAVIAMIFVLAGSVCMLILPISQFPEIIPPQVSITAAYPGASAEVVADTVVTPIESQVNGVENMLYIASTAANDGTATINVTFDVGTNVDIAAVNVQNRVTRATPQLPDIVNRGGVVTQKRQPSVALVVNLYSPDNSRDALFLSNYANIQVVDALKRVPGVGDALIFGEKRYSMRVWLNPDRMASLGIAAQDVQQAILEQNVQVAAGRVGAPPIPQNGAAFQIQINAQGRLTSAEQFGDIVLRTDDQGRVVRVRDIARIELGAQDYGSTAKLKGQPGVAVPIFQAPGSNAFSMASGIRAEMDKIKTRFPAGVEYTIVYDTTSFVKDSISEVIHTLFVAMLLVFAVVFIFLQSWRATIIPAITIPVSLIGTFALMLAFGFSINTVSLLGMVLAIGLVVDDAIVVVENVQRQLEMGKKPLVAARDAMAEVTAPIIATTAVLMAVFVPVAFIPGISGRLYNQFALTIAFSVLLSAINSLTLSPALCAVLLRKGDEPTFKPFVWFNRNFNAFRDGYADRLAGAVRSWRWVLAFFMIGIFVAIGLVRSLPTAFLPEEDQGYIIVAMQGPDGSSLERTEKVSQRVLDIMMKTPGITNAVEVDGYNFISGVAQPNAGIKFGRLAPYADRPDIKTILTQLNMQFFQISDARVFAIQPPSIQGLSVSGGFEFQLQDLQGVGAATLGKASNDLINAARKRPELTGIFTFYSDQVPQLYLDVDREKAKLQGLTLTDVFQTLQIYLGSLYVNDFNLFGRVYRVILQSEAKDRLQQSDVTQLYARNKAGNMVPLSAVAETRPIVGPDIVTHYNLYRSILINGGPAPGYSSGDAIKAMQEVAAQVLPPGITYSWTGVTFQQLRAGDLAPLIFALALVFVFLFLAAQYESWVLPVIILLAVPLALLGALAALALRGMALDIYGQIGLVMLIGLAAKNAILIVEFAKERREQENMPIVMAAVEAARLRLRPILMTAFAFILGVVPLVIATGAGASGRQSLGTTVFGGMLVATILSLVSVPVFFSLIETLRERRRMGDLEQEAADLEAHRLQMPHDAAAVGHD
ncbi:efflux RND transporter permease subunit [Roseiterribacter gracilis]|uniref:Efflux pump membrane transporter n=1 Tax=Roseiterribacter gracilis TaxID=2812848 RepID=A0A8S8XCH5_9PROT|nr:multidrug efflux RND transporter permease subunit [Rhodospirillales bacterium TMPK1]